MIFTPTKIAGVFLVAPQILEDERGFFARTWCAEEFARHGLEVKLSQCNISFSKTRGTIRGLHFQATPHEEAKLVRATRGAIFDVAVDIRPDSSTFKQWFAVELSADNHLAMFIPAGCAHGLQTLSDDTEVLYHMSTPYVPGAGQGLRWNDPAFGIPWPLEVSSISERDRNYEDFYS